MNCRITSIGNRPPVLAIIMAITPDLNSQVEDLERYLTEIDFPGAQIIAAICEEGFVEAAGKNGSVQFAECEYLAFTNAGVYPSYSLLNRTRSELEHNPYAIVHALRLDGTRDYGVFPNPYALGDWQCMKKETFLKIGGYDTRLHQAAGIESNLLGRAIAAGLDPVMMDERVYHAWHGSRYPEGNFQEQSQANQDMTMKEGIGWPVTHWPDKSFILHKDGNGQSFSMEPQADSVVQVTPHLARSSEYWQLIHQDKARRVWDWPGKIEVLTYNPVALDSPDHKYPDACLRECTENPSFLEEIVWKLGSQQLKVLDLGCAGGGMVAEFLQAGHIAVGLEGSSLPQDREVFYWEQLGGRFLHTCDVGYPFWVLLNRESMKFDLITAWDSLEHLPEDREECCFRNVAEHLSIGGIFVCSIAGDSSVGGEAMVEHHLTQKPQDWWDEKMSKYLERSEITVDNPLRVAEKKAWPTTVWRKRDD